MWHTYPKLPLTFNGALAGKVVLEQILALAALEETTGPE